MCFIKKMYFFTINVSINLLSISMILKEKIYFITKNNRNINFLKNIMKVIAIIPARGGSKGIEKKNIVNLAGKPLIAHTIEEALKSKKIDKIIVSTEDDEIAKISRNLGVEVQKRPIELAKDDTPTIDVVFYGLKQLKVEKNHSIIIILLQPTSPLRTVKDIDESLELFLNSNCESLISVSEVRHPPQWSLKIENGLLQPLFRKENLFKMKQELEKSYMPNGAIFIATKKILEKYKTYYCKKIIPYIMPTDRSIDIDDDFDLKLANFLIKNKK